MKLLFILLGLRGGFIPMYVCVTNNNNYPACSQAGQKNNKMKNLILSAAVILSVTFHAGAAVKPVNDKAQQTFNLLFKDATNVKWTDAGNNYEAFLIAKVSKPASPSTPKATCCKQSVIIMKAICPPMFFTI